MKFIKIMLAALILTAPISLSAEALDMNKWRSKLVKQIAKYKKYPPAALNREIEGAGRVRVTFAADGSIANFEVTKSTGATILDREIPKVLNKLKMPKLPTGEEYTVKIPFTWRLQ